MRPSILEFPPYEQKKVDERIELIKEDICELIRKIIIDWGWPHKDIAQYIKTSRANVSRATNFRTDDLSLNQLFDYLAKLEPNFKILIALP